MGAAPEVVGHSIGSLMQKSTKCFILTLYIMSDAYIGLDQQYDFKFEIVDAPSTN